MKQTIKSGKLLAAVLGGLMAVSLGVGPGGGGGGGAARGGGGGHSAGGGASAAPAAGTGGAHASAPATVAPAAAGGGGHVATPSTPGTGGIRSVTPGSSGTTGNSGIGNTAGAINGNTGTGSTGGSGNNGAVSNGGITASGQSQNHHRGGFYNPYVPSQYRNGNQYYGIIYGYPWAPFSYGWGSGYYGYGSGYTVNYGYPNGSTYSPFLVSYDGYGNQVGTNQLEAAPQQQQSQQPQQAVTTTGTPVQPSPAAMSAMAINAVDQSPAMAEANGQVRKAQTAYDAERARVLTTLREKPEYKKAVDDRRAASHEVAQAKKDAGNSPSPAVVEAATAKLEAGDDVTKMEEQAVATDQGAAAAKSALDKAVTDRDTLRARLMADVKGQMATPKQ